ncbi:PREDICTED: lipopolysaccharide-induced tumor necrosis factor-alpha factor homolog isoform X2 [Priapulus caudatus]|uniref:Lipopolysaccharide-induced tumor necrosis factor-alpha factor homolog isoform X2 n=1 Tax=Priapulus caudatus TaxID=37621 RepID=A0ABM1F8E0_PRICU|nr:PREDICTED: lipopolysaccharide-induced tumor necrosis factor-alpha factor homolog isoform X2 [Priapulus caudatus]
MPFPPSAATALRLSFYRRHNQTAVESRDDRYTDDATVERGGLGRSPVSVTCPHCKSNITTVTTLENGKAVWIAAVALTLICCCCIPFCIDDLKDAVHSCPSCKERIGTHKKI